MSKITGEVTRPVSEAVRSTESRSVSQAIGKLGARHRRLLNSVDSLNSNDIRSEIKACQIAQDQILNFIRSEGLSETRFLIKLQDIDDLKAQIKRALRAKQAEGRRKVLGGGVLVVTKEKNSQAYKKVLMHLETLAIGLISLRDSIRNMAIIEAEVELSKLKSLDFMITEIVAHASLNRELFSEKYHVIRVLVIEVTYEIDRKKNTWWRKAWKYLAENVGVILRPIAQVLGIPVGSSLSLPNEAHIGRLPYRKDD